MAKKSAAENAKKKKANNKSRKSGPNAIAMKVKQQQQPKDNPFETIWSRRKFDILGKKRKGEERRVGLARSIAVEKRKKTLLKEYEQSGKASVFLDKRIGEQNEELPEFDKAILRSQRERQLRLHKKSKYNLSDGEEEELEIAGDDIFSDRDDFEDAIAFDEDDDDDGETVQAKKRAAILKHLRLNGNQGAADTALTGGEDTRQKTKKEVMEELISKSKFFKAQKAKDKEGHEQLIEQLDRDFSSMVQSEGLQSLTQPNKMNALKALVNKNITLNKDAVSAPYDNNSVEKDKPDDYDMLVGEMILDMRARPSDRTKTPEEIAEQEKERLERLEEERQKRMLAADESNDEDGNASDDDSEPTHKVRSVSGDDLGDSFQDEETRNKLGWIDEILKRECKNGGDSEDATSSDDSESAEDDADELENDEESDGGEKSEYLKDWEQSDDDNIETELEDNEGGEEDDDDIREEVVLKGNKRESQIEGRPKKVGSSIEQPSARQMDLPYTIEAPKSLEELSSLLENRSDDKIAEAIMRIRTYNAISLAAENRKKMQVFYGVLLQYFAVSANKRPLNLKILNLLFKPLMEMSMEIPYFAAICARQRLLQTRTQFCEDVKDPVKGSWPSLKTLFLLRLWSMIFPCSDFRHVVMTPAILLMCEYLIRCPISCGRDVAIGSLLSSMVLSVTKQSQKFCPEALVFLQAVLMAAFDHKPESWLNSELYSLMELKTLRPLLHIRGVVNKVSPLDFLTVMDLPEDSPVFDSNDFRASLLVAVIETLRGFANIYAGLTSFPEIFLPISKLLSELAEQEHVPDVLKDKIEDLTQFIWKKINERLLLRQPLKMRKQKPVPIKLLNPKFEENFVKGRDYDPDRERAERKKLKKLLRSESKGAARELRKDNYFLFDVKKKEKALLEEERQERYGKTRAFLQEQEHAFKSGQLGRSRKRRR